MARKLKLTPLTKELLVYLVLIFIISPAFKLTVGMEHPISFITEIVGVMGALSVAARKVSSILKKKSNKEQADA